MLYNMEVSYSKIIGGQEMSRVAQLLRAVHAPEAKVITIGPKATVWEASKILREKQIGALPVLDEGKLVGIITERDMNSRLLAERIDPALALVVDYMTKEPFYVTPFTDLIDCVNLMKDKKIRHVPVLEKVQDGKKLVGIVSVSDILEVLLRDQTLMVQQFEAFYMNPR